VKTVYTHYKSTEPPPPDVVFIVGMAVLSWLLIVHAAIAIWPGQRGPEIAAGPLLPIHTSFIEVLDPIPYFAAAVTESVKVVPEGLSKPRATAKHAGKRTAAKARRPGRPSVAVRLFSVLNN
jgi:hypothetical protein